jgi:hypothetical protein
MIPDNSNTILEGVITMSLTNLTANMSVRKKIAVLACTLGLFLLLALAAGPAQKRTGASQTGKRRPYLYSRH